MKDTVRNANDPLISFTHPPLISRRKVSPKKTLLKTTLPRRTTEKKPPEKKKKSGPTKQRSRFFATTCTFFFPWESTSHIFAKATFSSLNHLFLRSSTEFLSQPQFFNPYLQMKEIVMNQQRRKVGEL